MSGSLDGSCQCSLAFCTVTGFFTGFDAAAIGDEAADA
jgi:hypothetical protein